MINWSNFVNAMKYNNNYDVVMIKTMDREFHYHNSNNRYSTKSNKPSQTMEKKRRTCITEILRK